jgi:hypothetical protein
VQPWNIEINENHAPEEDLFTNSILEMQEIHAIIKNMRSNAAPGPDGLNAAFFKSS